MSNSPFIFGPGAVTSNLNSTVVTGPNDGGTSTVDSIVRAPAVLGTNVVGSNIIIEPGNGTGTGGSGNIIFKTAPAATASNPTVSNPQQTFNTNASSQTLSYTVSTGSNLALIVGVSQQNTGTISGITYGGVALTQISTVTSSANRTDLWYLINPTVGTANIVVSFSGNTNATVQAYSMQGVNQTTPFGTSAQVGTSGFTTISLSPVTSIGQTVIDIVGAYASGAATITGGQTSIQAETTGSSVYATESQKAATAGTTTMSYSWGSAPTGIAYIAVGVNAVAGTSADAMTEFVRIGASGAIGLSGANYGTSGQVLTSQGSSAAPIWSNSGFSQGQQGARTTFTSSGTFTTAASSSTSTVYQYLIIGAGGGGGGANGTEAAAGGGGAGGIAEGWFSGVAPSTALTVTIGFGGGGGGAGSTGGVGGSSSISGTGMTTVTCTGGGGGAGSTATSPTASSGGAGGTASGGSNSPYLQTGSNGKNGVGVSSAIQLGGDGGKSIFGGSGYGMANNNVVTSGGQPGAGGGGAVVTLTAGGAGGPGLVIITQVTP